MLTLVTVFQYLEDLPDRAAAEQVKSRMDWKYALRQELTWEGFHYADLCNFRKRLVEHEQAELVFEKMLVYLKANGYIKKRGKQRTDATHVLARIRRLSRLELVLEAMRLALGELVSTDAKWFMKVLPPTYSERYHEKRYDYRLKEADIEKLMQQAGQDGVWLLEQLKEEPSLKTLELVQLLQRVLREQFKGEQVAEIEIDPDGDCADGTIQSPHDPAARYGSKRGKDWQGYKVQVTDTAEVENHFSTDIQITAADENDHQALDGIQARLAGRDILPAQQYVDQAYMSGEHIATSREQGIDLRGYVQEQASSKAVGFRLQDFEVNIDQEVAICPAGKRNVRWSQVKGTKNVAYRAFFGQQCRTCPFFNAKQCTTLPSGRRLDISAHHEELQKRRREMQDPAFQPEMQTRNGVEGTLSELVRRYGLRRARYRGRVKMQFQAYFTAVAFNLKHLMNAHSSLFLMPWAFFLAILGTSRLDFAHFSTQSFIPPAALNGDLDSPKHFLNVYRQP